MNYQNIAFAILCLVILDSVAGQAMVFSSDVLDDLTRVKSPKLQRKYPTKFNVPVRRKDGFVLVNRNLFKSDQCPIGFERVGDCCIKGDYDYSNLYDC